MIIMTKSLQYITSVELNDPGIFKNKKETEIRVSVQQ